MKKIHRFLVNTIPQGETITYTDSALVHQITSVLRIDNGETIALFTNGGDDYHYTLTASEKKAITLTYQNTIAAIHSQKCITAVIAIPKGDTFELITQKLTEIGVSTIVPLRSDRTIKQSVRIDRLRAISDEALEQCGGSDQVIITEPLAFDEAVQRYHTNAVYFDTVTTQTVAHTNKTTFYIGPEGGWSDRERALFQTYNIAPGTLGARTLRAETAAIVAASTYYL